MNRLSLHSRMVVVAVLLTLGVTFFLDVAGIYIIKNYMTERYKGRITFLAKYLAVNSEVGVMIRDIVGLKSLAVNLLGEEDVASVEIFDAEGRILASQSRNIKGSLLTVETKIKLNKTDEENFLFQAYNKTPFGTLIIPGEESIGKVKIKYSTRGINRLILTITKQFLWISTGLMVVAGILFYFIVRTIVVDVTKLASISRMIGDGNLNLRADQGTLPETRELASAFNSMLDSIEESRKAYERITKETAQERSLAELGKFSLSVAHEVKNPLAIIKSSFDFLKKEYQITSDNTMCDYIEDEIKRLNRLIEDFLLFAKPGNIIFGNHQADAFLIKMIKRYEMLYDNTSVSVKMVLNGSGGAVRADSNLLVRVFDNVVKNAVEASPENGIVSVHSSINDGFWFVEITDQGAGFESGTEKKIFEPFFTTKSKGTGLGLALAYQIVKAHDGMFYAANSDSCGAVFTVAIPVV